MLEGGLSNVPARWWVKDQTTLKLQPQIDQKKCVEGSVQFMYSVYLE